MPNLVVDDTYLLIRPSSLMHVGAFGMDWWMCVNCRFTWSRKETNVRRESHPNGTQSTSHSRSSRWLEIRKCPVTFQDMWWRDELNARHQWSSVCWNVYVYTLYIRRPCHCISLTGMYLCTYTLYVSRNPYLSSDFDDLIEILVQIDTRNVEYCI